MKKVIIIPDSFKGTISAKRICKILREQVKKYFPECKVVTIPVADGGEGSVDCFLEALGGRKEKAQVHGPYMESMIVEYGILSDGTAVVETASCAGLPLVEGRMDPRATTTYGIGELVLAAVQKGACRVIVGLGGSCTNDGGCGMAAALGVRFYDREGAAFVPTGGTLNRIAKIDASRREKLLEQTELLAMCDITNPLLGPEGATYVFGPQKGADETMVRELEEGMTHYARLLEQTGEVRDICGLSGGGAAGGLGAGMAGLLGATLAPGIQIVLDTVRFDTLAEHADMILTGEGKLDSQSVRGKVISGISRRGRELCVPVVAIVGGIVREALPDLYRCGLSAAFSINQLPEDFSVSREKSEQNLETEAENLMRLLAAVRCNRSAG